MPVKRLQNIPGFSIDQVADATGNDPEVLRLENLDTDLLPPSKAIEATKAVIGKDDFNSYLPFIGHSDLRLAIAKKLHKQTGTEYDSTNVVITCGGTEGMFDALMATTDPGDEVILTDPTYAGMIQRVRLAGAIPKLVPFKIVENEWRLDLDALKQSITRKTKVMFIMNPSMPSGAVLNLHEWQTIAKYCQEYNIWLIYNAAMERILFDKRQVIHPAALPGMQERTITIGSVSKELRMIGWRVGWVVAPRPLIDDIARVHIYNAVTPTGISRQGAIEGLKETKKDFDKICHTWERRRNKVNEQLSEYSMISAAGGWSQLVDVSPLGLSGAQASELLLKKGKVAVTPMTHWGKINSGQFIRIVFSNESVERLSTLQERFSKSFS